MRSRSANILNVADIASVRDLGNKASRRACLCFVTVVVLLRAISPSDAGGEETEEPLYQAKAKYLYVMSKYVTWPASAFETKGAPIIVGVLGKDPFRRDLEKVLNRRKSQERPFVIRRADKVEKLLNCHVIFIAESESRRRDEILLALQGKPVLTVCEMDHFFYAGTVIHLFVDKKTRRIQFKVNLTAARTANLKINDRMREEAAEVWEDQSDDRPTEYEKIP